jgi:hypothetical protein
VLLLPRLLLSREPHQEGCHLFSAPVERLRSRNRLGQPVGAGRHAAIMERQRIPRIMSFDTGFDWTRRCFDGVVAGRSLGCHVVGPSLGDVSGVRDVPPKRGPAPHDVTAPSF